MKGTIIDLKVERARRRPRSVDVELEATVERGHVRVRMVIEGEGGGKVRTSGLITADNAHELGALLQRVALRVPPSGGGRRG